MVSSLTADVLVVACNHGGNSAVPVAALVAAAEVVDAQHIVTDNVPHVDGRHLHSNSSTAACENGL